MTINILFGSLTKTDADALVEEGFKPFINKDGDFFDYCLSIDGDIFRIQNTIGQLVPFGAEDINSLFGAVRVAKRFAKPMVAMREVEEELNEDGELCIY
jgi:hypothetical protein